MIVHRGTVEDTELVDGLVLDLKASHVAGGVTRVEKAKIGLIQFCISPPKTDVNKICVSVYLGLCVRLYVRVYMCGCHSLVFRWRIK